ncbi:hypothetical protein ALQ30_200542 [Pseudomonas syringae pv. persicae]|uniref:Uncharacterized protein n=1 Tax=Pseudomonas syringae pv. persicae TaxID=237306 RepID=A0A3M4A0Q2_9PSED|nr:hypothetical protein ALQ30_200542 [Pseudomonas syringae pv. persicae]
MIEAGQASTEQQHSDDLAATFRMARRFARGTGVSREVGDSAGDRKQAAHREGKVDEGSQQVVGQIDQHLNRVSTAVLDLPHLIVPALVSTSRAWGLMPVTVTWPSFSPGLTAQVLSCQYTQAMPF